MKHFAWLAYLQRAQESDPCSTHNVAVYILCIIIIRFHALSYLDKIGFYAVQKPIFDAGFVVGLALITGSFIALGVAFDFVLPATGLVVKIDLEINFAVLVGRIKPSKLRLPPTCFSYILRRFFRVDKCDNIDIAIIIFLLPCARTKKIVFRVLKWFFLRRQNNQANFVVCAAFVLVKRLVTGL